MDKDAVLTLRAYMSYESKELSDQQALDKLEEIMNELQEKFGVSISIDVIQRKIIQRG